MKKILVACSALALMVPFQALASDPGKVRIVHPDDGETLQEGSFKKRDLDEDGAVSSEELALGMQEHFSVRDADGDGRLSMEEILKTEEFDETDTTDTDFDADTEAKLINLRRLRFERLDTDADGSLSEAEFSAEAIQKHVWMDRNGDGLVTSKEIEARRIEAKKRANKLRESLPVIPKKDKDY